MHVLALDTFSRIVLNTTVLSLLLHSLRYSEQGEQCTLAHGCHLESIACQQRSLLDISFPVSLSTAVRDPSTGLWLEED